MSGKTKLIAGLAGALSVAGLFISSPPAAIADDEGSGDLLDATEAVALAAASGEPVVATALTDERTLVAADPETGMLRAQLTAGVARVRDGEGGWREPSAALVVAPGGRLRPEAAVADYTVSSDGSGPLVRLDSTEGSLSWSWPDPLPAPVVDGDTATFAGVLPDVDLVVKGGIEQVETFMVVKNREAAMHPRVRSFTMPASYEGLSPVELPNGAIELRAPSGQAPLLVAPARMWDSRGAEHAVSSVDAVEQSPQAMSAAVELAASESALTVEADASLLDDPDTVYPVVIDPKASLSQAYVVRVTEDFVTINDMTVDGKIGYNGWTAPYYKSRMFYQFTLPKNKNGTGLVPNQIVAGTFEYVQKHSPQNSPCKSTSTSYPGVRVRLYNKIDKNTDWPGPDPHPWNPVTTYMAVGNQSTCNTTYRQKWNVKGMLQNERKPDAEGGYKSKGIVTVGVYSAKETDAMGWRHYDNSTGSSPKLIIDYEPEPTAPTAFSINETVSTSPVVTNLADPTLAVKATLASGYSCRTTTKCVMAEFTIKQGSVVVRTAKISAEAVASGSIVHLRVNDLASGSYTAVTRAHNWDTKLFSGTASFDFKVDLSPGKPTWSWVIPDGWTNADALPANTDLQLQVAPPAGDSDVVAYCVLVNGNPKGGCVPPNAAGLINAGSFEPGSYQVSVAAKDAYTVGPDQLDDPTERTFAW